MNSDAAPPDGGAEQLIERFARRYLENHGAVIEKTADGWDALIPQALSRELDLPDIVSIRRPSGQAAATLCHEGTDRAEALGYGSPLIERMIAAATRDIPRIQCRVQFDYMKQQGFSRLIADTFTFHNAIGKVEGRGQIQTAYLLLEFGYKAQSDEQQEGVFSLAFHGETGVRIPDVDARLIGIQREYAGPDGIHSLPGGIAHLGKAIHQEADREMRRIIQTFQQNMDRRFQRDVRHLTEYYANLKDEMAKSLAHPGLTEQTIRDRQGKIDLLPDELRRKIDDLFKKYSIRITVRPCAVLMIQTPAMKIHYRLTIGKAARTLPLIFNPLTKTMDPFPCGVCGRGAYALRFNERLAPLCGGCDGG